MSSYLFVYGTLRPNHAPAEIAPAVKELRRVGEGTVRGLLYDFGAYPGLVLDESAGGCVHGTVLELPDSELPDNDELLRALDRYEDFHPDNAQASLFVRTIQPVTLTNGEVLQCWIYLYNRDPGEARRIPGGRYP